MQILNVSEMRLELEYRPQQWIIGLGLVCAVLAIALLKALFEGEFGGAGIASVMLAAIGWLWLTRVFLTVRLTADQDAGTLRIATVSLFGEKFRERDLTDLTGAEVETRFDESNSRAGATAAATRESSAPPARCNWCSTTRVRPRMCR